MSKYLPLLLLAAACATAPQTTTPVAAPPPQPAPQAQTNVDRYTLVGVITTANTCEAPTPSAIHMTVTLANAAHTLTSPPKRIGLEGRSYTFQLEWKKEWGAPTEWKNIEVTRFDDSPFCSNGGKGIEPFTTPVTGTLVIHDITLRCSCTQ